MFEHRTAESTRGWGKHGVINSLLKHEEIILALTYHHQWSQVWTCTHSLGSGSRGLALQDSVNTNSNFLTNVFLFWWDLQKKTVLSFFLWSGTIIASLVRSSNFPLFQIKLISLWPLECNISISAWISSA